MEAVLGSMEAVLGSMGGSLGTWEGPGYMGGTLDTGRYPRYCSGLTLYLSTRSHLDIYYPDTVTVLGTSVVPGGRGAARVPTRVLPGYLQEAI